MNPSILITPNAYKAGKLFSIIPTDGTGDLDVVRATSATRVNENGLIEIPATNLVLRSEEFNDVSWNKLALSVIVNSTTAPNGTNTADTILADGTNNTHRVAGNATVVTGTLYTISVYAKKNTNNFLQIYGVSFPADFFANFNLDTGTIGTVGAGATATITNIGNGWYRCTATGTPLSIGVSVAFNLINSITAGRAEGSTLSTSVYLWGAQIEQGITATEYIPTTTVVRTRFAGITQDGGSASNIPRLDYANGSCPSILVEPQRTNFLLRSEEFENSNWFKQQISVTSNNSTAPNGTATADKIIPDTTSNQHRLYTLANFSGTGVLSVYAKADGYNFLSLGYSGGIVGEAIIFNLTNGTISGTASGVTPKIENIGNGWYRCSISSASLGSGIPVSYVVIVRNSNSTANYAGDGVSGVLVWGAQVEVGSNATSYIPTTTTSVTRNADVISKSGLSGITSITETFENGTTNVISGSPTSYTMSQGRIKHVIGL